MKIKFTLILLVCSTFAFAQFSKEKIYNEMLAYGQEQFLEKVAEIENGKYEDLHYDGETLKFSYTIKNKKLNGVFTRYYRDGNIQAQGNYRDNELDGTLTQYHENKQIESIASFKNGELLPGMKAYYESGKLKLEESFDEAKQVRVAKEYYENGTQKVLLEFTLNKKGMMNGTEIKYHKNGVVQEKTTYKNNELFGKNESFDKDGNRTYLTIYNDKGEREGISKSFYPNGNLKSEAMYKNDKLIGLETNYYLEGQIQSTRMYVDGELNGKGIKYYKNGNIKRESNYKDDDFLGEDRKYYESGKLSFVGYYKDFNFIGTHTKYYENGKVKSIENFNDNGDYEGEQKEYNVEGKLTTESIVKGDIANTKYYFDNGKIKSTSESLENDQGRRLTTYYRNGQICQILIYKGRKLLENVACFAMDGKKINNGDFANGNGLVKFYNEDGKLYKEAIYKNGLIDDVTNYEVDE